MITWNSKRLGSYKFPLEIIIVLVIKVHQLEHTTSKFNFTFMTSLGWVVAWDSLNGQVKPRFQYLLDGTTSTRTANLSITAWVAWKSWWEKWKQPHNHINILSTKWDHRWQICTLMYTCAVHIIIPAHVRPHNKARCFQAGSC